MRVLSAVTLLGSRLPASQPEHHRHFTSYSTLHVQETWTSCPSMDSACICMVEHSTVVQEKGWRGF